MFSKSLKDVTCDDVRAFCSRNLPESKHLDYKDEVPNDVEKIAKTVAAFANTQGGWILFGVKDENDRPLSPFEGMNHRSGLRNRIEQIVRDHVQPVPYIETHVCDKDATGKTFVVVHVPQSNLTPHYLTGHKAIYVRTGESSNPEDIAEPDKIPWLYEARKQSIELRTSMIESALLRYKNVFDEKDTDPSQTLLMVPLYPQEALFSFENAWTLLKQISFEDHYSTYSKRAVTGGIIAAESGYAGSRSFAQILDTGLVCYRDSLFPPSETPNSPVSALASVIEMCKLVSVASSYAETFNFYGPLLVRFELHGVGGRTIEPFGDELQKRFYRSGIAKMPDDRVRVEFSAPAGLVTQNVASFLMECARRLVWALGFDKVPAAHLAEIMRLNPCIPHSLRRDGEPALMEALLGANSVDLGFAKFSLAGEG